MTISSQSSGLYGNTAYFGGTYFQWSVFIQSATAPATPTGGSWNFQTNVGTPPSGWSNSPPSAPTQEVWVAIAFVSSLSSSTALVWSTPGLYYQQGTPGTAATITAGTTTTLTPGNPATVTNSGTSSAAVFNFGIPQGATGATGSAATITAGTTTTLSPGASATVSNSGSSSAAVFNFGIPQGVAGNAATITAGTTTTLSPGSSATVTNSGTSSAAVFNFGIPQGTAGATGPIGMNWRGNWSSGTTYAINDGVFDVPTGSSYIAIASSTNQEPPNASYWNLVASKGANGTGSGTVTSVAASVPSFLSISGSPVTSAGTLAIGYSGTALPVANGGTGATTLTGYTYGNGTNAMTASTTIPNTAITGLGTMSTQNATSVAVTGGTINGTSIGATTRSSGDFTTLSANTVTSTTPVLSFNASNTIASFGSTTASSYNQLVIQNLSNSNGASANYVISNNLGTDSSYYGEFGMNSSTFSASTPTDFFSINNEIYFSGHDGDIAIGSGNGYKTYIPWGTTPNNAHVINASGAIGLSTNLGTTPALSGTTGFGTPGQVFTSQGPTSAPTWTTSTTGTVTSVAVSGGTTGLTTSGGPITGSGTITLAGTLAVANGGTGVTTSTGSGSSVLSTSPTLVTPVLGTPTSVTLTNATGLPLSTGVTGTLSASNGGTGVSNNAASTITISGNYGSTFVVSGAYSYTFPASSDTLVNLGSTQTLTNKTLTNPTVTNYTETLYSIGNSSTAVTISLANGTYQTVTMTGNCTFTMPSVGAGKSFILEVNSGAGSFTGTFTSVKWPSNTAPTLTTTASRWDILAFFSDGTNWYGNYVQAFQ